MKVLKDLFRKRTFIVSVLLVTAVFGTAATLALATAKTNPVVNSFKGAEADTSFDENGNGAQNSKKVSITNNGESDVFVRAKIKVSPENAGKVYNDESDKIDWILDDGYYYYKKVLSQNQSTSFLMGGIEVDPAFPEDQTFDVTVYQETCIATESLEGKSASQILQILKDAFEEASGANVSGEEE